MIKINEHYLKLSASYLFSEIGKRIGAFQERNPDREIIRLGIGDVTRALPKACIAAFRKAVEEMADESTFRGYGPDYGYSFLREKIASEDFQSRGADIAADEIFVSDGAKSDTANIQEIFATDITVAIPDPVYPVYLDTNVMAGRTGENKDGRYEGIVYLDCTRENHFIPELPKARVDLIYLCFPNNPTGATITRNELKKWVDFARENKAIIVYDAAYEAYIRDEVIPRSIYEIEGAVGWPSSRAVSRRPRGSPERVAPIPWSRRPAWPMTVRAGNILCMPFGAGATPRSSTASPIPCSGQPKRYIPGKAGTKCGRSQIITCTMPP